MDSAILLYYGIPLKKIITIIYNNDNNNNNITTTTTTTNNNNNNNNSSSSSSSKLIRFCKILLIVVLVHSHLSAKGKRWWIFKPLIGWTNWFKSYGNVVLALKLLP